MKNKNGKNFNNDSGFTIIEALAAIFVFSVGVTAVIFLISREINFMKRSDDRLAAVYLAQEGIEIVRNIREENWLNGRNWRTGQPVTSNDFPCNLPPDDAHQCNYITDDTPIDARGYVADYTSGLGFAGDDPPYLCFYQGDRTSALLGYRYNVGCVGGTTSKFKRVIYLSMDSADPAEMRVRSVLEWGSLDDFNNGLQRTFEVAEIIKDWNRQD